MDTTYLASYYSLDNIDKIPDGLVLKLSNFVVKIKTKMK